MLSKKAMEEALKLFMESSKHSAQLLSEALKELSEDRPKGRLSLSTITEKRTIVGDYETLRAVAEAIEQPLQELWSIQMDFRGDRVTAEGGTWRAVLTKVEEEETLRGYSVYKNEHFYHFVLSRREAEFCAQQLQERYPEAKIEIREEEYEG